MAKVEDTANPSEAEEIERLRTRARETDKGIEGELNPPEQEPDIPQLNEPGAIADALYMVTQMAQPYLPSLTQVYTPENCMALSKVSCDLANKHGWDLFALFAKWKEEIMFAFVAGPLFKASYLAVLHDLEQRDIEKKRKEGNDGGNNT